jgi:primosomal protein N' (replication factor Y)
LCQINSLNFYECAIIGTPSIFTYQSINNFNLYSIVEVSLKNKTVEALIIKKTQKPSFKCLDIIKLIYELDEKEIKIINFISYYYFTSLGEAVSLFTFQKNNKLENINIKIEIDLTEKQKEAFEFCENNHTSILFGDTGSGKTEIYIKLIEKVINENRTAILLLPEIAITSQMEKRLKKYFGEMVAIWHSKITKSKKKKILKGLKEGKIRIVAGARSALFLPMQNLGVIIVDEFHDDSYKSQSGVRYNAKDLAIYFAKVYNINVVLGSATPLVSDFYKHPHFRLKGNFYNSKNSFEFVSRFEETLKKIEITLKENNQVIIFIPTRANFKYMICSECSEAIKCPFCDVGMSVHSKNRVMKCHYCNYTTQIPSICPNCGSENFLNERIGSSEIVEILKSYFPNKKIEKFDRDIITSKTRLDKTLKEFNNKKIDILVGTQMLSKGHDYDVKLAVILDIDFVLNMPDFRARERALSLVVQVAGRAGRRENGEVLIQTQNEEFFKQSYDEFIQEELEFRKMLNYPPFARLAKLEFSDKNPNNAQQEMLKVKNCLEKKYPILGFGPSPITKISNKYRYQILIKGINFHKFIWECKTDKTKVDMDVVNFI